MECYQSLKGIAKAMKLDYRKGKEWIRSKVEEVYVNTSMGKRRLVGYAKPGVKAYVVPKALYDEYVEWRDKSK